MSINHYESSRYLGRPVHLYLVQGAENSPEMGDIGPFGFTDGEEVIVRDGQSFIPWAIHHSEIAQDGTLDKSDITVSLALGTPLDTLFLAYPPSQVVNLIIYTGHVGDDVTPSNYPATWMGRIVSSSRRDSELELSCQPVSTNIKKPGLRRNYQLGCPHVLYGAHCKANKAAATVVRTAAAVNRSVISLTASVGANYNLYAGGLLEWNHAATGVKEVRTISNISPDGVNVTVRGVVRGVEAGTSLNLIRGCNRLMSGCNSHGNIHNFGGQPFIPLENPLSQKNQFY